MWSDPVSSMPPERIVVHASSGRLGLAWADGQARELSALALRRACRCAHCESRRRKGLEVAAGTPGDIAIVGVVPQGSTGVQLQFSDGHERGIYPWHWLRELPDG